MKLTERFSKLHHVIETLEIDDEFLQEPQRLARPGAWTGHLAAAFWLIKAVKPQIFVELGTHSGNSYSAFCQTIALLGLPTRAFAVDTWQGDEHAGFYDESVFNDLNAFNETHFSSFSKLLRTTFDEARGYFAEGSIDLLHIDGLHTYEAVKHDFETWRSAASSRAVVVFHDTNVRERDFGVWKLWLELAQCYPSFEFHHSEGLGVLGLGNNQSHLMSRLFECGRAPETATQVRRLFAARGETFRSRTRALDLEYQVYVMSEDIRQKSHRMSELDRELIHRDAAAGEKELQIERKNDLIRQQENDIQLKSELIRQQNQAIQLKEQLVRERDQTLQLTNESLRKAEQRIAELDQAVGSAQIELAGVKELFQTEKSARDQRVGTLDREVADLTRIRATLDQELQEARVESQRLRSELDKVLTSRSWRYTSALRRLKKWLAPLRIASLDPRRYRQHLKFWRDVRLLSHSTLFDAAWYLANNPDVAQAGVDPITHYLQYGAHEGRDPSESFNTSRYLENNPDVRQAGVNPLVHYLLRGAAEGRFAPAARRAHTTVVAAEPYDVFAYISTSMDPSALPKRVAIGVSSLGNFFMAEIAYMMENAFRNLGATTRLFAEHEASNVADYETVVVVAPHEFFLLGQGPAALQALKGSPALIMFNVEQGQTQWFRVAEQYLPYASAVLDISYHTARRLARSGYKSFFLPLGYSDYLERSFDGRELPEHEIFKYMPAPLRSYLPTTYAERPIDILFIGASSPRRKNFFSQHGSYFADKASFIYLPDTTRPFLTTESRTINFATFVALLKRSKILLNVHQDDEPFFEWQRIVNLGIMQRTLVISDHCEPVPCIEPNIDYLDGPLAALPALCEFALNDLQEAERIADHAYTKLKTQYPMEQILAKCWTALARTLC